MMNFSTSPSYKIRLRLLNTICGLYITFIISSGFFSPLNGQVRSMPDVDDKELYIGALHFVARMYDKAETSSDANKLIYMRAALCREIGLNESDLALLVEEAHTSESTIWRGGPYSGQLQGNGRTNAIRSAKQRLAGKLSAGGWNSFRTFVNGPFRQASFVMRAQVGSVQH
jgi:hypothetical protein